ncbi:MAG: type III pantothenate kinase, partial [Oscillibacter sp.]|nr:type III pantothenate kinase [Oscillibacter sp.]
RKTADQICVDVLNLFRLYGYEIGDVTGAILCSVVPPLNDAMEQALTRLVGKAPMIVGPGVKTGLNIRLAVQSQVGADIVADAVAAAEKFAAPIITIDMGTATAVGVISEDRTYEGGMLLPGVRVSLEALSRQTAQLPAISLQAPKALIGKTTEECMRSGIVYGSAAMLDGIIDRIREEFPGKAVTVVATGGNAPVIVRYCKNEIVCDPTLLMEGLWTIYQKNC